MLRQFVPARIGALADDRAIEQDQWQTLVSVLSLAPSFTTSLAAKACGCWARLYRSTAISLVRQPMEIRREMHERRVDGRATYSG